MNYKELFKLIWVKLLAEIVILCILFVVYLVGRYLLPKKYRLKAIKFKEFLKTVSVLLASFPNKDDGIIPLFNKSKNIFEHLNKFENLTANQIIELNDTIAIHKLELHKNYAFSQFIFKKIHSKAIAAEVLQAINPEENVMKYTFDIKGKICEIILFRRAFSNGEISFSENFGCTPGFDSRKLINLIFDIYGHNLYLQTKNDNLFIETLDLGFNQDNYIPNLEMINDLQQEIQLFKKRGYQRSYILNGPPGTGKTTFCLEMSRRFSGKIIKLDSNFFNEIGNGTSKFLFKGLEADFIIADDIDRINPADMSKFLFMLENIKNFPNQPTLMVTVNNINNLDKAIIRPGRFDDIIEFSLPNKKERYSFIKEYLMKLGSTIEEEDCQVFSELTEGMTQAYLKEYCLQFVIEQNTTMLFSKIEKRKKYLGVTPVSGETESASTFSLVDIITGSEEDNEYDEDD